MSIIDNIQLHDAYITGFEVRTIDDHFDVITVYLESSNFISDYSTEKIKIVFKECFKAIMNLQMWISGKDSIREISENKTSKLLEEINSLKSKGVMVNVNEFNHYHIELNSSASTIEIISKGCDIVVI